MLQPILANAGIPMIVVQMPALIALLPVVIAIESFLSKRWFDISWRQAWVGSSIANVVSTIFGFPILWFAWVLALYIIGGPGSPNLPEPWFSIFLVTVQAAWLLPFNDRMHWMIPIACIVLLLPTFFVSFYIESKIYMRVFSERNSPADVKSASWRMHLITYGVLLSIGVLFLVFSISSRRV